MTEKSSTSIPSLQDHLRRLTGTPTIKMHARTTPLTERQNDLRPGLIAALGAVVFTVRVVVCCAEPLIVTEAGTLHVAGSLGAFGVIAQLRLMVPVNPPDGVTVNVAVPALPGRDGQQSGTPRNPEARRRRGQLENRAPINTVNTSKLGGSVEVAGGVLDHTRHGHGAVGAFGAPLRAKTVQHRFCVPAAAWRKLENSATATPLTLPGKSGAAEGRRSVEIAGSIFDQSRIGTSAVGVVKAVQHALRVAAITVWRQLEHRAATGRITTIDATRGCRDLRGFRKPSSKQPSP